MFAITLQIDGRTFGDGEPEPSSQTIWGLGKIASALDPAIDPQMPPEELWAALSGDANHDRHLVNLGEGLDRYGTSGFVRDGKAYLLVVDHREQSSPRPEIYAVDADELTTIVERASAFFTASVKDRPRS